MVTKAEIATEQERLSSLLLDWQRRLYLGDWHLHVHVRARKDWTSENDAYTVMEGEGRCAYIEILYEREKATTCKNWQNNNEIMLLHELGHIFMFDFSLPVWSKKTYIREEHIVNKLALTWYQLKYGEDATKDPTIKEKRCRQKARQQRSAEGRKR